MVIFQGQIIFKKTCGCYCCFRSTQSWWHKAQMCTDATHWIYAQTAASRAAPQGFSRTLAPGDSWPLPSEFWGELILWTLGDSSGAETCVAVAVAAAVVGVVGAPTASARSGGRSSSSLRLLKAHEALLITTTNRGVEGRGEGWDARAGAGVSPDVYQMSSLREPIYQPLAKATLGWIFCHLPRDEKQILI